MSKIIDFPVKKTIYTCAQCKIFNSCYSESLKIFAPMMDNRKRKRKQQGIFPRVIR